MPGFAELMALSARQTEQSDLATQSLLLDRRKKEEARRKEQEERARKEREFQNNLIRQRFEEERRERERQQKAEEEKRRRELLVKKREEEQVNHILYGNKKSKYEKTSREEHRPRKRSGSAEDGYDSGATALTREEKRLRKQNLDMNRALGGHKRSSTSGYHKSGMMLAGGAINTTTDTPFVPLDSAAAGSQSIKQRLAATPNTLTKLNTVKRDTRTIDEILQDRAKARESKVLNGDEARAFHDWFSTKKKDKPPVKSVTTSTQPSLSPSPPRTLTPVPQFNPVKPPFKAELSIASSSRSSAAKAPATNSTLSTPMRKHVTSKLSNETSSTKSSKAITMESSKTIKSNRDIHSARASMSASVKRPRSPSGSVSPPSKRRSYPNKAESSENDISSEIWRLFGKRREQYIRRDVISDDEDMEAGADDLEMEELRSARLARKEDEEALEEERRHEEEKRRRRKEREARERRA